MEPPDMSTGNGSNGHAAPSPAPNGVNGAASPPSCEQGTKIFVGGIRGKANAQMLELYFSAFGVVVDTILPKHHRGFGFVTFQATESVDRVLQHKGHLLDGKNIDPKIAVPKTDPEERQTESTLGGAASPPSCEQGTKIFVGGISGKTNAQMLRLYFSAFGVVVDTILPKHHRGFGFVTFQATESVDRVLQHTGHLLDSKNINPKIAIPKNDPNLQAKNTKRTLGGVCSGQGRASAQQAVYRRRDYFCSGQGRASAQQAVHWRHDYFYSGQGRASAQQAVHRRRDYFYSGKGRAIAQQPVHRRRDYFYSGQGRHDYFCSGEGRRDYFGSEEGRASAQQAIHRRRDYFGIIVGIVFFLILIVELGHLAIKMMSSPASSAFIERVFSNFGIIRNIIRDRLGNKASKLVYCHRMLRQETELDY